MEVPFLSSSAISRAQYSLVRKVEAAPPHQVDDLLCQEVEALQSRLDKHRPTPSECVEILVLLLYCVTATNGRVTRAMLKFALPHAFTLAEAGHTMKQKRTGYLFCNEIMDPNDEQQVMLVNTLRKDLEDSTVARICLALDVLMMNCPPDAIPAVAPRLVDLLGHNSSHVKRKTMAVIRRISPQSSTTLRLAKDKVRLRLKDSDPAVVGTTLRLLGTLTQSRVIGPEEALDFALDSAPAGSLSSRTSGTDSKIILAEFLGCLATEPEISSLTTRILGVLHQMLVDANDNLKETALILEIFRALSRYPMEVLTPYFLSSGAPAKSILGQLIVSPKPNIQYSCLVCLLLLDPTFWAGTTSLMPPTFDESQVYRIMGLLSSPDSLIRKKTLQVLNRVDSQILSGHLSQLRFAVQTSPLPERTRIVERILEVAAELDTDGEAYASRLDEVLVGLEGRQRSEKGKIKKSDGGANLVYEGLVEQALVHLRTRSAGFHRAFVDVVSRTPASDAGPTLTLVIAAAVCEYGALSSISQEDLLRGLAGRLSANPPAIQEALLLTMLRVTARCDSALPEVTDQVRTLYATSRSHIRRRCDQYVSFSADMASLTAIANIAESDTLPDFIYALENAETHPDISPRAQKKSPDVESWSHVVAGKLRYEAYDPPRPVRKFTRRQSSTTSIHSHATSSQSGRSDSLSSYSRSRSRFELDNTASVDTGDILSRTMTAGDLALAAHQSNFSTASSILKVHPQAEEKPHPSPESPRNEDQTVKPDLIAFDSPFLADPNEVLEQQPSLNFHEAWDALKDGTTSRGWCETSPQEVKRRIGGLPNHHVTATPSEVQPEKWEFLLVISGRALGGYGDLRAALRLIPGEDESTLWQLRCLDAVKADLRTLLDDA